ncbi:hypothetical protein OROMI_009326 [Orobanche minor]
MVPAISSAAEMLQRPELVEKKVVVVGNFRFRPKSTEGGWILGSFRLQCTAVAGDVKVAVHTQSQQTVVQQRNSDCRGDRLKWIVMLEEIETAGLEEFCRMLLSCAALNRWKEYNEGFGVQGNALPDGNGDVLDRLVCVTNGVSYLGIAIVNQLLLSYYSMRIIADKEDDVEKLREMQNSGEMRLNNSIIEVFMAKLTQVESLIEAFDITKETFIAIYIYIHSEYNFSIN